MFVRLHVFRDTKKIYIAHLVGHSSGKWSESSTPTWLKSQKWNLWQRDFLTGVWFYQQKFDFFWVGPEGVCQTGPFSYLYYIHSFITLILLLALYPLFYSFNPFSSYLGILLKYWWIDKKNLSKNRWKIKYNNILLPMLIKSFFLFFTKSSSS